MMNLLVNCSLQDYAIIHQFIVTSKQLDIELEKRQTLTKIFQDYTSFVTKRKKIGEKLTQNKNTKTLLETLRRFKF